MTPAQGWRLAVAFVIVGFLATVASYYDRTNGLTVLLSLPANSHDYELPAVRGIPHAHNEVDSGYDGQFYAQMAVDPLLRDPDIDRAMDKPAYRAHRILLSWVAWLAGAGDAAWAVYAFAWINVVTWLVLAWVMTAWCAPRDARTFTLWAGVLALLPGGGRQDPQHPPGIDRLPYGQGAADAPVCEAELAPNDGY